MDKLKLYHDLAKHLDQGVMGAPPAPSLIEILMLLFSEEEAMVAITLPNSEVSLEEAKLLLPGFSERIEEILERMADGGTVFTRKKSGKEKRYRLFFESLGGWLDSQFWSGKDAELLQGIGPLWLKYRQEGLGEECARDTPLMRVIPIETSFKDKSQVLSFDELSRMIERQSFLSIANCSCRLMTRYAGKGCDHLLETCLHFGPMGRYLVDYNMARQITKEEALEITAEADREGLVHLAENIDGYMATVCNCCSCCCSFLNVAQELNLNTFSYSNYTIEVNDEKCKACGSCQDRCPMHIHAFDEMNRVTIDESLCIGCGVCISACEANARVLVRRKKIIPPPNLDQFLKARYKAPKSL
jgi:NAD-dependent dihydropyrimidine dehydrogenase PreA subunit